MEAQAKAIREHIEDKATRPDWEAKGKPEPFNLELVRKLKKVIEDANA